MRVVVSLSVLVSLLGLAACGDKAPPASAGSAPVADAAPSKVSSAPADGDSQAFARRLVATQIANFSPSDTSGAKFLYNTLAFRGDGTFAAAGYVEMEDEKMECAESGPWTMEPATSSSVATVSWTVEKTNCAGRDAGQVMRAEVKLQEGADPVFSFR